MTDTATANETFARRLREARESAALSQAKLSKRLTDVVGYDMSRQAIAEIEVGDPPRRVTVDEWLALSAALGVAPLYMVTPFESEEVISTEAAEEGIFEPTMHLRVGNVTLIPVEARRWIRGKQIFDEAPLDDWPRYYCVEVPPAVRYRLRQLAAYVRDHMEKVGRWSLPPIEVLAEERENEMAVPGLKGRGVPQSLWTWIKSERELEEES